MTKVRCLGVGPEHTFNSQNPKYNRICSKCQFRIRNVYARNIYQSQKIEHAEIEQVKIAKENRS